MIDSGAVERFASRIIVKSFGECWPWIDSKDKDGYGGICINNRLWRANRVAWIIFFGFDPKHLHVLHSCDRPACVNPLHLFLGTNLDNINDMDAKRRRNPFGMVKLTKAKVLAIRRSRLSQVSIAKQHGISQSTVSSIRLRRTWRHL